MVLSSKKRKTLLTWLLLCVLVFNLGAALFASPAEAVSRAELNALKKQQAELAKEKAAIQKQADEASGKVNAQTEKLNILRAKLDVTNSELDNLSEQITIYTDTIADLENELNIQEQHHQELLEKSRKAVRDMEENGSVTYLGVLLGASSFNDLLSRIECIREIIDYNNNLINEVRESKEKTMQAKADMETEMAEQETVFQAYQEKQADLAAQQEEAQVILLSLKADSTEYQQQLNSVKTLQSSLSTRISNMEATLAELERIRAEQAAAAKLAAENSGKKWYGDSAGTASGQEIVDYAKKFLGVKYVYGGTSPKGFDCSGLVYYCYKNFGYSINRTASSQARNGRAVSASDLQPGDIVIFTASGSSRIGHCGLYIGNGQFIHAPHTGDVVKISSLATGSYKNRFWGARRIVSQ